MNGCTTFLSTMPLSFHTLVRMFGREKLASRRADHLLFSARLWALELRFLASTLDPKCAEARHGGTVK
jgi:hypothetical protein